MTRFLWQGSQFSSIQANFRGFQVRRQYRKICFAVGVLEKAILRWRLKRKGFRGLQVQPEEPLQNLNQETDGEEDFYKASRKQAEERVERSVVRVQAMFRSRLAQEEYRRMKLECSRATVDHYFLLCFLFSLKFSSPLVITGFLFLQLEYEEELLDTDMQ